MNNLISYKQWQSCVVFTFHQTIDLFVIEDLFRYLRRMIEKENLKKIIFDLSQVEFIDSSGIGMLIKIRDNYYMQGYELRLCGLNEDVKTIFELSNILGFFEISETASDAINYFNHKNQSDNKEGTHAGMG
jgi:anti-anti-sigma factor